MSQTVNKYNPNIKMFYGKKDDASCRLIPSPTINISTDFNYSNDTIIGYTYNITLTGKVTALDLRDYNDTNNTGDNKTYGIGAVVDHIHKLRTILSKNGSVLHIINNESEESKTILSAKGGILRSFDINPSPNQWHVYAEYTAKIEFHSVDFIGATWNPSSWQPDATKEILNNSTSSVFLDSKTFPSNNDTDIVNIHNFKIKSFNDSWSFNFNENDSYNKIKNTELDSLLNIDNTSFDIQYTINATGKHFYVYQTEQDEQNSNGKLIPAWEQAKNFVQYRLYSQVTSLLDLVLENNTATSGCSGDMIKTLENAHAVGSNMGLLKDIGDSKFMIFNEKITCSTSESDGSFSATYSATAKTKASTDHSLPEAKHTIKKTTNSGYKGTVLSKNISIEGTIEGLLEGGLIRHQKPLVLPRNGSFIVYEGDNNNPTKYDNAKKLLDKIYNPNNYNNGFGINGKRDLNTNFKNLLGVTESELGYETWDEDPRSDPPHPVSFNVTHNYANGTISYSAEYNNGNLGGRKYREISIRTNSPTPVIATFAIPNSDSCGVIQELGTQTAKTVSVTIRGVDRSPSGKYYINNDWLSQLDCMSCNDVGSFPVPLPDGTDSILTKKEYTKNPNDGSFTVNLEYTCNPGCNF